MILPPEKSIKDASVCVCVLSYGFEKKTFVTMHLNFQTICMGPIHQRSTHLVRRYKGSIVHRSGNRSLTYALLSHGQEFRNMKHTKFHLESPVAAENKEAEGEFERNDTSRLCLEYVMFCKHTSNSTGKEPPGAYATTKCDAHAWVPRVSQLAKLC